MTKSDRLLLGQTIRSRSHADVTHKSLSLTEHQLALRRNILISFGTNGAVYFLQFLTTIVVSRLLTPEQVGLFAVSMAVVAVMQGLREFGIVSFLVQEKELTDEKVQTVFAFAIVVGWSLGALLYIVRSWFSEFYGSKEIESILTVLAASFFFFPFGLPATAMLRRERQFGKLAIISVCASIAYLVVTCSLAWRNLGALSQAYGVLVSAIVLAVGALFFWPQHLKMLPTFNAWRLVASFGSQASAASLITRVGMSSPELVIGKLLGLHEAAIFNRGRVLTLLVERFTIAPIAASTVPELAHRLRQNQDVHPTLLRVAQVAMLLGWSVLAFMSANAFQIIRVIYGPQWVASAALLQVLCLCQAILLLNSVARVYLDASGAVRTILRNEIFSQTAMFTAVLGGAQWSLLAVCWMLVAASAVSLVVSWTSVVSRDGIEVAQLFAALRLPTMAAAMIYFSQIAIDVAIMSNTTTSSIFTVSMILVSKISAAACLGLLVLKLERHFLYNTIVENLYKLFGK